MSQGLLVGGGALGGMFVVFVLTKFLIGSSIDTLKSEIDNLGGRLKRNDDRIAELEKLYDEQRREKHRITNEYTKVSVLLGVIVNLAERCTCGALDTVRELMHRVAVTADGSLFGHTTEPIVTTTTTTTEGVSTTTTGEPQ